RTLLRLHCICMASSMAVVRSKNYKNALARQSFHETHGSSHIDAEKALCHQYRSGVPLQPGASAQESACKGPYPFLAARQSQHEWPFYTVRSAALALPSPYVEYRDGVPAAEN